MSWAGVRCRRFAALLPSGGRYRSTNTGSAQGLLANGNWTRTASTTYLWPYLQAV